MFGFEEQIHAGSASASVLGTPTQLLQQVLEFVSKFIPS